MSEAQLKRLESEKKRLEDEVLTFLFVGFVFLFVSSFKIVPFHRAPSLSGLIRRLPSPLTS